jgi:hypothetical protein
VCMQVANFELSVISVYYIVGGDKSDIDIDRDKFRN